MKPMKPEVRAMIAVTIIVIFILIIALELQGRNSVMGKNDGGTFSYKTVEIQGMTCIRWGHPLGYKGGLTCNWDEWDYD